MRKRKAGSCINLQEVAEFQRFVNEKMAELVEEMRNTKKLDTTGTTANKILETSIQQDTSIQKQWSSKQGRHS